jgi:5'-3' exonuclease
VGLSHYLRYRIPHDEINMIVSNEGMTNINFFIDLASISRGFYNKTTIKLEIANYMERRQLPTLYISELKQFLNEMFRTYKHVNPKFVLFYDAGNSIQNKMINESYKGDRGSKLNDMLGEEEAELFQKIKHYYFNFIDKGTFEHKGLSTVINLGDYESDLIPELIIDKQLMNSTDDDCLNIILSSDKDLLQCCRFKNTYQAISIFRPSKNELHTQLYNHKNAIGYIHKTFKEGILFSDHVPLLLAISGDKADNVKGIKGYGPAKAVKLIMSNHLDSDIDESCSLPEVLEENREVLFSNIDMISFERQILRIDDKVLDSVTDRLKNIFE